VELSNSAQNSQTDIGQSAAIARVKRLLRKSEPCCGWLWHCEYTHSQRLIFLALNCYPRLEFE